VLTLILGYTFVLKRLSADETAAVTEYERLKAEIPEAASVQADEMRHEKELINMLDEERLQYVGSMVLGLNDALVELTGTIAGLSFALQNTRVVALSGIITGVSATLSMAASNYLAERADGNEQALKSSMYTGIAYLITVALLVLPYLLLPDALWWLALAG
jgi:VIT1/CCC1 family predicted Fe2+/Mn2+ transporter